MEMWDDIAAEVAQEFPDVTWDKMLADAMTVRMTLRPESLDTIVATNLHDDILSDLAGAMAESLSVVLTANIDPERCFLSMFEPIHRSAARSLDRDSPTRLRHSEPPARCSSIPEKLTQLCA
jgi:tartrate dehydrogenase/decarboxylase/D-malate dehydrogenase